MIAAESGSQPAGHVKAAATHSLVFFAASAKNVLPRLVHGLGVAAVAAWCVGPLWAALWLAVVAVNLGYGARQRSQVAKVGPQRVSRRLQRAIDVNAFVSSAVQFAILAVIWRTGEPLAQAFALMATFVGAAYVLLQYYADLRMFRLLLAPYALGLAYMAVDAALQASPTGAAVTLVAGLVVMVNFFFLSRRSLDRSRSALRDAREAARRGAEAAEAANGAKSAFLATMSHEIRTPLNGVLGMAQAMAADRLSGVQRERLGVIHSSGEALLAILNDVLDLSKIEAGRLELEHVEFDLGEVARGAYSAFTALANKKGLSFALDIEGAKGRYLGDPTRLRQVLYNLISNALKFTEEGEIRVSGEFDGQILQLSVADTGVGIAPENLGKLFRKFDQLDSSTTRRFGGTGLGLSICRELAELMGGDIAVESRVGRGSRFTVRLPLPRIGAEKVAISLAAPPEPAFDAVALKVLAAEDNSVNQLVLKTLLHQLGVEPTVVDNGLDAVEAWRGGDWDLILMDIQMPGMDGLTATAEIRAAEARTGRPRTPIIALTANAMSHQVEQYHACGMDGHVAKPIEAAALFEALDMTVQQRQAEGREAAA